MHPVQAQLGWQHADPSSRGWNTAAQCRHRSRVRSGALPEAFISLPKGHVPTANCSPLPPEWPNRKENPLVLNETR